MPLKEGRVGMYVCGPTVYDEPHIGHLRSAYIFDVIRKYLEYKDYDVTFVRNVTDIDDKIIEKAKQESKSVSEIAEFYLKKYHDSLDAFVITPPDIEPKATEHIKDMIEAIKLLIIKGYAYRADGDVYFCVRKFKDYGKLSGRCIDELMAGARIEPDEKKKDPLDFALWKHSKQDEASFESPWGQGRPGWHIECSVMSARYLGESFDFHCGGIDLVFPHHENEIAQSESFSGQQFARYWLHNGLLTINGEKMSKSLGNFISTDELLKSYSPEVLKLFFLDSHYSNPVDFSWEKMEYTRNALKRFYCLLDTASKETEVKCHKETKARFEDGMEDDFNTPAALASLFNLVSLYYKGHVKENEAKSTLIELGKIFGLFLQAKDHYHIDRRVRALLRQRDEARKRKDYKLADRIRSSLFKEGIILEDEEDKTIWRLRR